MLDPYKQTRPGRPQMKSRSHYANGCTCVRVSVRVCALCVCVSLSLSLSSRTNAARTDEPSTRLSPAHPKLFHTPHPLSACDCGYISFVESMRWLSDKSTRRGLEKEVMRFEVASDKARHMQHLTRSSKALGDVFAVWGTILCASPKRGNRGECSLCSLIAVMVVYRTCWDMRCTPMLGRDFEFGTCLHLFIQNCFVRAMRLQCGHSMCTAAQQLVGQDMQGQAPKWQLRGEWSRKDKVLIFKLKVRKSIQHSISQETISTMI